MNLSRYTGRLNELRGKLQEDVARIKANRDLNQEAKDREIAKLQRYTRAEYTAERKAAEERLEADLADARRRANPKAEPVEDTQAELLNEMRRQRVERELGAEWEARGGGPTLQEYEDALEAGDTDRAEVMEIFGPANIQNGDIRDEFTRKVQENRAARLSDEQREALEEQRELEQARYELGVTLAMQDRVVQDEVGAA